MPSDAKKREQQRKKDAAKARQTNKKPNVKTEDSKPKANGVENGTVELSPEGMMHDLFRKNVSNVFCVINRGLVCKVRSRCEIKC